MVQSSCKFGANFTPEVKEEPKEESPHDEFSEKTIEQAKRVKEALNASIPQELIERAKERGDWSEEWLEKCRRKRAEQGFNHVRGIHMSDKDITGDRLEGDAYYADSLDNLYAGKKPEYLYVVEGSSAHKTIDEDLGWHKTRGQGLEIVCKVEFTPQLRECLEASFADCTYKG